MVTSLIEPYPFALPKINGQNMKSF